MKYAIDNVITRTINSSNNNFNAIYIPYNGYYEWMIRSLPVKLYAPKDSSTYEWPCNNWPQNLTFLPSSNIAIPNRIDIDCIITNHRKNYNVKTISETLHLPILYIDHELPLESANNSLRKYINGEIYGKNSFYASTHEIVEKEWLSENSFSLPYGFEINQVVGLRTNNVLVVGDYHISGKDMLNELLNCSDNVVGLGYNNNTKHYESIEEMLDLMKKTKICISLCNPIEPPFLPLLAASCGCAVVTNATRWTTSIFENKKNAILFDKNILEVKQIVKWLLENKIVLDEISHEAKNLIKYKFNIDKFNNIWKSTIQTIKNKVFIK